MRQMDKHSRGATVGTANEGLQRLVRDARENPQFFHDLVWNTDRTVTGLEYLSAREKASILAVDPASLIGGVGGQVEVEVCGASCGGSCGGSCAASCGGSCGASCGGSCENSCAGTCGGSCGTSCGNSCAGSCVTSCVASGGMEMGAELVTLPGDPLSQQIAEQVQVIQIAASFSRFRRF